LINLNIKFILNNQCHSSTWINTLPQSSGSGSESATYTRKSAKSRSNDASENNSDSHDENDHGSKGLSIRDGSDNGSGTQVLHSSYSIDRILLIE